MLAQLTTRSGRTRGYTRPTQLAGPTFATDGRTDGLTHAVVAERVDPSSRFAREKSDFSDDRASPDQIAALRKAAIENAKPLPTKEDA